MLPKLVDKSDIDIEILSPATPRFLSTTNQNWPVDEGMNDGGRAYGT